MLIAEHVWKFDWDNLEKPSIYTIKHGFFQRENLGYITFSEAENTRLLLLLIAKPELYMFDYKF